jgi:hypothetical protein
MLQEQNGRWLNSFYQGTVHRGGAHSKFEFGGRLWELGAQ